MPELLLLIPLFLWNHNHQSQKFFSGTLLHFNTTHLKYETTGKFSFKYGGGWRGGGQFGGVVMTQLNEQSILITL